MNEGYQNLRKQRPVHKSEQIGAQEEGKREHKEERKEEGSEGAIQNNVQNLGQSSTQEPPSEGHFEGLLQNSLQNSLQRTLQRTLPSVEIIAELSANHGQDLDLAFRTLRAMAQSGADAVKLQSYDAQSLTLPINSPPFVIDEGPWAGLSLHSLYEQAAMPWAWHQSLYKLAGQLGLEIFSSPFCLRGVDFLEQLETPRYKIASFEFGHLELVQRVAATGKPIIASLGIARFADIERFLETCHKEGNDDITLLQCTSAYPASPAEANLAMIPHLKATFGCRIGLSDHSLGSAVALAAVALGAELIEKHFILSRELGGPDAHFSMEPQEFATLVQDLHKAKEAIGKVTYKKEEGQGFGRAIFMLRDLREGELLQREDVAVLRPCPEGAIAPYHLQKVLQARLRCDVSYGTALEWDMLDFA